MKDYQFKIYENADIPFAGESFLFNSSFHLNIQSPSGKVTFALLNTISQLHEAWITFFINDLSATSPLKASFGSIEFIQGLSWNTLMLFWDKIEEYFRTYEISQVRIVNYPSCYAPDNAALLHFLFLNKGFHVLATDLNFHILTSDQSLFSEKINKKQLQELKKCQKKGYTFHIDEKFDPLSVHEFVSACRQRKGYPVTLTKTSFAELFDKLGDKFVYFAVKDKDKTIALTFGIKINSKILYNFFMADDGGYTKDSPTVMLLEGMYNYCRENNFELLDYGTASDAGVANPGLIRFKERTGGIPSLKHTYFKSL